MGFMGFMGLSILGYLLGMAQDVKYVNILVGFKPTIKGKMLPISPHDLENMSYNHAAAESRLLDRTAAGHDIYRNLDSNNTFCIQAQSSPRNISIRHD